MHWSEFMGGDVVMPPPHKWQLRYNESDVEAKNRVDDPMDPKIVAEDLSHCTPSQTPELALRKQRR